MHHHRVLYCSSSAIQLSHGRMVDDHGMRGMWLNGSKGHKCPAAQNTAVMLMISPCKKLDPFLLSFFESSHSKDNMRAGFEVLDLILMDLSCSSVTMPQEIRIPYVR